MNSHVIPKVPFIGSRTSRNEQRGKQSGMMRSRNRDTLVPIFDVMIPWTKTCTKESISTLPSMHFMLAPPPGNCKAFNDNAEFLLILYHTSRASSRISLIELHSTAHMQCYTPPSPQPGGRLDIMPTISILSDLLINNSSASRYLHTHKSFDAQHHFNFLP